MAQHLGPNRRADLVMCVDGVGWLYPPTPTTHLSTSVPLLPIVPPPVEADAANIEVCLCVYTCVCARWLVHGVCVSGRFVLQPRWLAVPHIGVNTLSCALTPIPASFYRWCLLFGSIRCDIISLELTLSYKMINKMMEHPFILHGSCSNSRP